MVIMDENRYGNGAVYKVVDVGYNKCYIGSTCESLCKRMTRHRDFYKSYNRSPETRARNSLYNMFDEYGVDNCKIELIEYYPCNTREELRRREGEIIKATECVNKRIEGRTRTEYLQDNAEYRREYCKNYNRTHKESISENKKKYYIENKDKFSEVVECECGAFISRHWMNDHKKSNLHQRYLMFKNGALNNHIECSCGSIVPKHKMNRHIQSQKHIKYKN